MPRCGQRNANGQKEKEKVIVSLPVRLTRNIIISINISFQLSHRCGRTRTVAWKVLVSPHPCTCSKIYVEGVQDALSLRSELNFNIFVRRKLQFSLESVDRKCIFKIYTSLSILHNFSAFFSFTHVSQYSVLPEDIRITGRCLFHTFRNELSITELLDTLQSHRNPTKNAEEKHEDAAKLRYKD